MRVVVEIQSGPRTGQKVLISEGHALTFGRTEWADVVFQDDSKMSSTHFSLEAQSGRLHLKDLGSTNGTSVNQTPVQEAWVADGDVIQAGDTRMTVRIEGVPAKPAGNRDTIPNMPPISPPPLQRASARGPGAALFCTRESCESGLTLLRGGMFGEPGEPPNASIVASLLSAASPMTLLVHTAQTGQPAPETVPEAVPLFDWLPEELARRQSPLICPPGTCPDVANVIDAGWDNNVVLCFFSRKPAAELVKHLRAAVHFNMQEDGDGDADDAQTKAAPSKSMLGYCWPSVMSALLYFGRPEFVRRLLAGIDAVLMEMPDLPGTWQVICESGFADALKNAGFRDPADQQS